MNQEERKCIECEEYEQDYTCRRLVDWLGQRLAKDCVSFKRIEGSVVFERVLEAWR